MNTFEISDFMKIIFKIKMVIIEILIINVLGKTCNQFRIQKHKKKTFTIGIGQCYIATIKSNSLLIPCLALKLKHSIIFIRIFEN